MINQTFDKVVEDLSHIYAYHRQSLLRLLGKIFGIEVQAILLERIKPQYPEFGKEVDVSNDISAVPSIGLCRSLRAVWFTAEVSIVPSF